MTQTSGPAWRSLGLDDLEERVFRALVEADGAPPQVAAALDLPAARVRAALQRLLTLGLVQRMPGSRRFSATPPETALGALVAGVQAELAAVRISAGQLQAQYDAVRAASGAADLVEVITGEERIVQRFGQLMNGATEEVMAFVAPPFLAPGDYEEDERDQLDSGVRYRVIYDPSGVEAQGGPAELLAAVEAGEEARVAPRIPVKMFVVDRSSALVPLSLDIGPAAVVVSRFGLVDALVALFELVWESAWPLADYAEGVAGDVLTGRDRRLVGLMRSGYTDEAIARALGVTARTVARRLAVLMAATDATTRFQLGWRLAELEAGRPDE
ncbi:MAG: helix-turn-helix domain-containing protein [Nocardioidaceae bacterium]